MKPLILLDVDGVINVSGSAGVRRHKCFHDGWKQAKVWAYGKGPYRIFYNPAIGRPLRELVRETGAELAWATMWEHYANQAISPLLGLPQDLAVSPARSGLICKAEAVVPWTKGRPFVLFEDEPEEIEEYAALTEDQPCLLVLVDEYEGLTQAHLNIARSWLLAGSWKTNQEETAMPEEQGKTLEPVKGFDIGATVEHRLLPGFRMTVQDAKPCETDALHPSPHQSYLVDDPEGGTDWVCHYDVQEPGAGLPWGDPE